MTVGVSSKQSAVGALMHEDARPETKASHTAPTMESVARPAARLPRVLALAAGVAVVGSCAVAALELLALQLFFPKESAGGGLPARYLLAALGRIAITHLIVWLPALVFVSVAYWPVARRREAPRPLAFLCAAFTLLCGSLVAVADLDLAKKLSYEFAAPALVAMPFVAALVYVAAAWASRRAHAALGWGAVGLAALALGVSGAAFARSPLFDPGAFRISTAAALHDARHDRPNVLWVVLDTVRADHLTCYGAAADATPFLAEFAGQALVFDRAIADGMWTIPSHASMFTGRAAREHGMGARALKLDARFPTVAGLLRKAGYETALFSNNPLVSERTGLSDGFAEHLIVYDWITSVRFSLEQLSLRLGLTPRLPWLDYDRGAALTNDLVAHWLDRRRAPAPSFVFVNYMEAHLPYSAPRQYRRRVMTAAQVDRSYDLRLKEYGNIVQWLGIDGNVDGCDYLSSGDVEILRRQYAATVCYVDDRVRELIELYERRGLLDRTLVVITADHGEYLDDHGMWSHHMLTYQDLIWVPMLLRPPGGVAACRVAEAVQLSDLHHTVLAAALGAEAATSARVDADGESGAARVPAGGGRNLLALPANAAAEEPSIAIAECYGPGPRDAPRLAQKHDPAIRHRAAAQTAAIDWPLKYLESSDGLRELFDLEADPGETTNLAFSRAVDARRLANVISAWRAATPEYQPTDDSGPEDEDMLRTLRALGYVGDHP